MDKFWSENMSDEMMMFSTRGRLEGWQSCSKSILACGIFARIWCSTVDEAIDNRSVPDHDATIVFGDAGVGQSLNIRRRWNSISANEDSCWGSATGYWKSYKQI